MRHLVAAHAVLRPWQRQHDGGPLADHYEPRGAERQVSVSERFPTYLCLFFLCGLEPPKLLLLIVTIHASDPALARRAQVDHLEQLVLYK